MVKISIALLNNNALSDSSVEIIEKKIVEFVMSCPHIFCTLILAGISGHLWTYIILAYFSKRERKFLNSRVSKIGLGILWFAVVLIPIYLIFYNNLNITIEHLKEVVFTVLAISLALQAVIVIVTNYIYRNRKG